MKAIILGCGRQGALLARILEEDKVEVTIIDRNPNAFSRLEKFGGKKILGNGIVEKTLEKSGIKEADAFAAVTGSDNVNLMASQIAKSIYKVPLVVCQIFDPRRAAIYAELGLNTVNFSLTSAKLLRSSILGSGVVKKYQLGNGTGIALEVRIDKCFDGKTLSDLEIEGKFRISSVIRGLNVLIPDNETKLKADDHVFGVVHADYLKQILDFLGVAPVVKDKKESVEGES